MPLLGVEQHFMNSNDNNKGVSGQLKRIALDQTTFSSIVSDLYLKRDRDFK